jgi:hypothetical protein
MVVNNGKRWLMLVDGGSNRLIIVNNGSYWLMMADDG